MASVFKRGRDQGKRRAHWYVSYTDHLGRRRTKKGFTDKSLSEQMAAKLENEAMLRERGLIDPDDERIAGQKTILLSVHLDAFERSLAPNSEKYTKLVMSRVRRLVKECGFEVAGDLDPDKVSETLAKMREKEKFGHRTFNHYLQALQNFTNWLVTSRRLASNPIVGLERLNVDVDIRHQRRALSPEEVAKLVESARTSDELIQCYTGEARSRVYIASYMTGLRRKELASLTPRSFDLQATPPTVTIQATVSKHRKKDVLPLHSDFVLMLKEWVVGMAPDQLFFPELDRKRTWLMVQKDLNRAGIEYKTAEGIADFHAAGRHSHVTELLRSGASLPEARELARHADIRTTMKYTHIGMDDRARALGNLRWQRIGSGAHDVDSHLVASNDNESSDDEDSDTAENPYVSSDFDTSSRELALIGNDDAESSDRVRFPPPPLCQGMTTGDC
jgi:site-specific recombinase XerC